MPAPILEAEPAQASPAQPAEAAPEIGFHNSLAVRIGFLVGLLALVVSSLPFPPYLSVLWLVGAGFLSVHMYRRRSRQAVSVRSGARMGWITGLCCFAMFTVVFTLSFAAVSYVFREGGASGYFAQLRALGFPEENVQKIEQVIQYFASPLRIVSFLLSFFVMFTGLVTIGGAIGAKVLGGQPPQSNSGTGGRL